MPNNIFKISSYTPKSSDVFFFDNNIWMYLFCPLGNFQKDKRQKVYSRLLGDLLSRKLHIYTNALVLSEFSNRYLKLDYDLVRKNPANAGLFNDYKRDYVGSPHFIAATSDIKRHLSKIISICQKGSDEFNSINLAEVFNLFERIGFNDSYYIHLASKKGWIIVTDDSDFTKTIIPDKNLTILTY